MNRRLLKDELIRDEGLKLEAYQDSVGLWTIGVGHLLGEEKRMTKITMAEAMALLEMDIDSALQIAFRFCPELFPGESEKYDVRARALTNMAFNLGDRIFQFQNTRHFLRLAMYSAGAENMLDSKWAGQVGDRAKRIAKLIETGVEQTA